ncbi:unnamed protein product [Closterium sp. NIES-65]|nr:unnamed protein product [Closterium sp. NIES-65]
MPPYWSCNATPHALCSVHPLCAASTLSNTFPPCHLILSFPATLFSPSLPPPHLSPSFPTALLTSPLSSPSSPLPLFPQLLSPPAPSQPAAQPQCDGRHGRAGLVLKRHSPRSAPPTLPISPLLHPHPSRSQQHNPSVMVGTDAQGWFRNATPRATEIFGNAYEHALNTGILFFRASPDSVALALTWHHAMRTRGRSEGWEKIWGDQHAFNMLLRYKMFPIQVVSSPTTGRPISNRVFWAFSRRLKLALLPLVLFCNGHVFFEQQMPRRIGVTPYAVHSTFQFHYGAGKIGRFREAGLWALDPPECWLVGLVQIPLMPPIPNAPPALIMHALSRFLLNSQRPALPSPAISLPRFYTRGNFLSFDVKLPVWIEAMPTGIDKHQATIEYAYAVTRKALAIARLLNRFLILPHVTCYCDRWWDSLWEPCRAPGGDIDPPFTCPIDLFINPMAWGSDPTTMVYRPASFLSFPQVPNEIRLSKAVVGVRYGSVLGEEASSRVPAAGEELFAKLPSDQLLRSEGEGVQKHGESVPGYSLEGGNRRVDFRNRGSVQDDRRELGKEEGRRIGGEQEERGSRSEGREKERVFLPANATDGEVQRSLGGLDSVRVLHLADAAHSFCRHVDADTVDAFDKLTLAFFTLECALMRYACREVVPMFAVVLCGAAGCDAMECEVMRWDGSCKGNNEMCC